MAVLVCVCVCVCVCECVYDGAWTLLLTPPSRTGRGRCLDGCQKFWTNIHNNVPAPRGQRQKTLWSRASFYSPPVLLFPLPHHTSLSSGSLSFCSSTLLALSLSPFLKLTAEWSVFGDVLYVCFCRIPELLLWNHSKSKCAHNCLFICASVVSCQCEWYQVFVINDWNGSNYKEIIVVFIESRIFSLYTSLNIVTTL